MTTFLLEVVLSLECLLLFMLLFQKWFLYIHTDTYIYFMQAHMHIYIHVKTHIYTGTHMPSMDICGNTCTKQTYRNTHIGSNIHTLTHTYICIYALKYIYILNVLYIVHAE